MKKAHADRSRGSFHSESAFRSTAPMLLTQARIIVAALIVPMAGATASAQELAAPHSYTVVRSFTEPGLNPMGRLVAGPDDSLYGVTNRGGAFGAGTVFVLRRQQDLTWKAVTLSSFYPPTGARPRAGLVLGDDGNFYGVSSVGGPDNRGSIYRVTPSGTVTVVRLLSNADGTPTDAPLMRASDGSLWGTLRGGPSGSGAVYRITPTGEFVVVHAFTDPEGGYPAGGLVEGPDGAFYGVNRNVFRITPSGLVTTVRSFGSSSAPNPELLIGADGALYGTSFWGGAADLGTVFRLTLTGDFVELHAFAGGAAGEHPAAGLLEVGGVLYGTTAAGPSNWGTVYRLNNDGGNFAAIATFAGALGSGPSGLVFVSDALYGTTLGGGATPTGASLVTGTAFSLPLTGPANLVWTFASDMPAGPVAGLVERGRGQFYGVSCLGGWFGYGTVFKVTSRGRETLHSFDYSDDGACPSAQLTLGPDGNLYGTTKEGGTFNGAGTIFKVSLSDAVTVVYQLEQDLEELGFAGSIGELAFDGAGRMYGTRSNFFNDAGSIFRLADGVYTTLHRFTATLPFGGLRLISGLVRAGDGNFYGTLAVRGANGEGSSLFRVSADGAFAEVRDLGALGMLTFSTLLRGRDGALYGNALTGGTNGGGVTFRSTLAGSLTALYSFGPFEMRPFGRLTQGADGTLYGMTFGDDDWSLLQFGTIFRLDAAGHRTLHRFKWLDGANPMGGLTVGSDGALYGTTLLGGSGGRGVVFRLGFP